MSGFILLPLFVMKQYPHWSYYNEDAISILSILGLFGGLQLAWMTRKIFPYMKSRDPTKGVNLPNDPISVYELSDYGQDEDQKMVTSIWDRLTDTVTRGVLSVKQACKREICTLSPVELAYLGHIDILELQRMRGVINDTVGGIIPQGDLETLRSAARTIIQQPLDYKSHRELTRQLKHLVEGASTPVKDHSKVVKDLVAKITEVDKAMQTLMEKPYSNDPDKDGAVELQNYQILIAKLNLELASLRRLKLNTDALEQRTAALKGNLDGLKDIYKKLPKTSEGWKPIAEDILILLDTMNAT